jgi:hypothetical protein
MTASSKEAVAARFVRRGRFLEGVCMISLSLYLVDALSLFDGSTIARAVSYQVNALLWLVTLFVMRRRGCP